MVLFDQFCKINQEGLETKVMKEPSSLEIIQQDIKICKKCELCNTRNNAVPGIGDKNADVVFIGEAPGKNEDIHGEPFIGTAGKILDNALENAGLTRNNVYITNIVKCRPPNNRVPNDIEKSMCNNYLEEELQIINPKIICLLGNTSFYSILGGKEISKNHGQIIYKNNRVYFITFHPAATIYNQKLLDVFKNDIKKLVNELQKIKNKN
jgi:DNA polymerase|tara:strand:+ start:2604 stop:3230 length:627 start_codon:yes stop_codon:yes gene_type:complete